ncbi:unnamed protein product [Urochloa humidicola]
MSRWVKGQSQLGGGTTKGRGSGPTKGGGGGLVKGGGSSTSSPMGSIPPAAPMPTISPTPLAVPPPPMGSIPPVPWLPGYGGSSGQSSSPQSPNSWVGYLNMLQQPPLPPPPHLLGENSHFVGVTNNLNPPSPAPPSKVTIDIDGDDGVEASRSAKKRYWTHDEEVRLASAWLNTSKDPVHGNDKKTDSFWGQITKEFNKDTHPDRARDTNQLKIHWTRLSRIINEFNGYWSTVCKMHKSGYSDDQLMDEAQEKFKIKHGKPFSLVHWWKILKNEPKWCTFAAQSEKDKGKTIHVDDTDDKNEARPIGREAAKAERKGKRKAEQVMDGIVILGENISKIVEVTQERKKEREKVTEAQLRISSMNLQAANKQKEAKLLEAYSLLLSQDRSHMSDEAKASQEKTLLRMEKMIYSNDDEA